jgi:hypothetical protein
MLSVRQSEQAFAGHSRAMKKLFLCFVFVAVSSGLGCITTPGDKLANVAVPSPASSPAIEQTVGDFSFHLDGGKMVTSNKMGRELNNEILRRWVASGYIASHKYVKSSEFSGGDPFQLTLEGHQEGESSILLQILSGLTLYLIPHYVDSQMALTYLVENAATGCSFRASVDESYNTIISLWMIPVSPFVADGRDISFARIADHLYLQLAEQGAFDAATSCSGN